MNQPHDPSRFSVNADASYLIETYDLSICLLDLPQLHEKVPEPRLRDNRIWCKDSHAVELWVGVGLGWQMTANDLVFLEAT